MAIIIDVIDGDNVKPFGRYISDGEYSGERYCNEIAGVIRFSKVKVDLSGYNRYGSSWLEECFGGLVRIGYPFDYLNANLEIAHDSLQSVVDDAWKYILRADVVGSE